MLVRTTDVGAIATVASTRKAYASANTALARVFFNTIFINGSVNTLGYSYVTAKRKIMDSNSRVYSLLGDPSIKYGPVSDSIKIECFDSNDKKTDTLSALQMVTLRGTIYSNGTTNRLFGSADEPGWVEINLLNPQIDTVRRKDGGDDQAVFYALPGTPVFSGITKVIGGEFEQKIFLPRRLTFDEKGVELNSYAWHKGTIASGFQQNIIFHGTANSDSVALTEDTEGPEIMVRPIYEDPEQNQQSYFAQDIQGMLPLELEISAYDQNGIDIAGYGPDEGVNFEIIGAVQRMSLNERFKFVEGDFRKGAAIYTLKKGAIAPGTYQINVSAQDHRGNISVATINLDIIEEQDFKLGHVFNYPNPARAKSSTQFFFHNSDNRSGSIDYGQTFLATIKIYTLSGRLIRVLKDVNNGHLYDLRDHDGNYLAPNTYLYQLSAYDIKYSGDSKREKSGIQKLVVHPR